LEQTEHYDIIFSKHPTSRAFVTVTVSNSNIWDLLKRKVTFKAKDYQFSPKYKQGIWDGRICMLKSDGTLPVGLVDHILEETTRYNFRIKVDYNHYTEYSRDKIENWVSSLAIPFEPRDYQFKAFYDSICKKLNGIISITGSGKSLIIYMLSRFFQRIDKKVLIVVPTISLVDQMFGDFEDYGFADAGQFVQKIKAGKAKEFKSPIIVSTWQSIYKLPADHFDSIGALIVDECHQAESKSLLDIQQNCRHAVYRIGLSGTVPYSEYAGYFNLVGLFGKFEEYLTYAEAFERGYISPMDMNVMFLDYPEADRQTIFENKKDYQFEVDFVCSNNRRNIYLMNLLKTFDKNTLMLFTKIESHGRILYDLIRQHLKKPVYYIDGSTKDTEREEIRKKMEVETDVILLASYGVFSTGVNVKNIHNVVFASAYRSEVKTFQSIGRGLRTLDNKNLQVYDIVDVLAYRGADGSYNNYLIDQFAERHAQYKLRDFNIIKKTITI
jgi:superfamily II DNA or RNA helicase